MNHYFAKLLSKDFARFIRMRIYLFRNDNVIIIKPKNAEITFGCLSKITHPILWKSIYELQTANSVTLRVSLDNK